MQMLPVLVFIQGMGWRSRLDNKRGLIINGAYGGATNKYSARVISLRSQMSHSSFYYKRSGCKRGIKPSTHTVGSDGEVLENAVVVSDIEKVLHQEFCCYGYRNMTEELKEMGWIINHKKVYRLMKEHRLLYNGKVQPP